MIFFPMILISNLLRKTLVAELRKRDIPEHILESVAELFTEDIKGAPTMYFNPENL